MSDDRTSSSGKATSLRDLLARIYGRAVAAVGGARPLPVARLAQGIEERRTVLIKRPRRDLFRVLKHLEHLPRFLDHLSSVTVQDGRILKFTIGAGDRALVWLVQIVEEVPGHRIAWESLPGSDLIAEGALELRDGPHGDTIVDLSLRYAAAPGVTTTDAALLEPLNGRTLALDLLRLRDLIETGVLEVRPEQTISGVWPRLARETRP